MHRIIRLAVIASVAVGSLVAVPTSSPAASLGYKITNLTHPQVVVPNHTFAITGVLVDSGGQPVAGQSVYLGAKSPGKACAPSECESSAYPTKTKPNGAFAFSNQYIQLDTAYVVYPPDSNAFSPDLNNAVPFAVHTHNVYRWAGATTAKTGALLSTRLALGAKKTAVNAAAGAPVPLTQVRRGHGKWHTASRGAAGGLFDGFDPFGFTQPAIVAASRPGRYRIRVIDHGATYQDAARSATVSLKVKKRHAPSWLKRINHYRHSAGVQPMFESKKFDKLDRIHAKWMNRNNVICHCEIKGQGYHGYTRKGDRAGRNSVLELGVASPVGAVDLWMGAPFHATCLLNQDTSIGGFGSSGAAAALWCLPSRHVFDVATSDGNVLPARDRNFTFPSRRMKVPTSLLVNRGETPDPRKTCRGHWDSWSAPVLFRVAQPPPGDRRLKHFRTTIKQNGRRVGPTCSFSPSTFHSKDPVEKQLVRSILAEGPWVVMLVKPTLHRGATYKATLKDGHFKQSTRFTVAH